MFLIVFRVALLLCHPHWPLCGTVFSLRILSLDVNSSRHSGTFVQDLAFLQKQAKGASVSHVPSLLIQCVFSESSCEDPHDLPGGREDAKTCSSSMVGWPISVCFLVAVV